VRRFADSWILQYSLAALLLAAIIAGGVFLQRFAPMKSLVDRIVPPPRPVEGRVAVPTSEPTDSAAERILAAGLAKAKREDKRVFFHASGAQCEPCQRLNRFLEENRDLFQSDFVNVKVDLADADFKNFSNGFALLLRLRKKYNGVPWIAILEPDGHIVATSDLPSGETPASPRAPKASAISCRCSAEASNARRPSNWHGSKTSSSRISFVWARLCLPPK
jgi:hypothetical protein